MVRQARRTAGLGLFLVTLLAALLGAAALAAPMAEAATVGSARDTDAVVVITGDVRVQASTHVGHVILVNGDARVDGVVDGDVFVVNGYVRILGRVKGDVTSLNGRVTLGADAFVTGDVVSKDPPRIADGAHVGGDVDRARDRFALGRLGTIGRVFLWVAGTVSSALLGVALLLLVPRGMDAAAEAGRSAIGPAIGLGFAVVFGVPIVGVILAVTLLGLPLGLALLFGLGLLYGAGYAIGALIIGRVMVRAPKSRWLAFLAGWGLLRVLAIVPVLGILVLFATVVYGLGSAVVAVRRSQRHGPAADAVEAPVPAAP
ncbi:MAG TPA: polymer-forming cytoskeletal protein [Acidimicrobiia bacterium]|nr:polymer-forming cytoskeletal protein [Acidimicrobiia bacterium]